ncbi:MAG: tyrosine--tRNA ligase [Candidatus Omnitrophota bacterium]
MSKVIKDVKTVDELINSFARTTDEILSLEEFKKLLLSGRQLRMKYGVDVTAADLHIGHAVNLWMYRKLQDLGHKVIFLIGDFTTQIGDPTGKNKTRPVIPPEEIKKNAEHFIKQALMILKDDPDVLEIRRNSEWFGQMPAQELLSLMSMVTCNHLMARDMFRRRIEGKEEIYAHELVYPIFQAYDSVILKADLTVIGSDQLYNEMIARFFQEKFQQPSQVVITTKITPGIDGKEKQSKSLNNYIGLLHSPRDKFGRLMSIPDKLIADYFKVYTDVSLEEIKDIKAGLSKEPMKYKLLLAKEIVKRYHGEEKAEEERNWFVNTFSKREAPETAKEISVGSGKEEAFKILRKCFADSEKSNSDIRRLFQQGAVKFEEKTITKMEEEITIPAEGINLKAGKRTWFKIKQ